MQYKPCNLFVPAVNSAKINHKNILWVTIIDSHGHCENAWKEAYFHLCVPAFQSKHKAWIMHIYVTSVYNQPIHLYNTTAYTLAIQKQANRVVSLMVWHVISVGIWHSGLYEGMNKDIFVILFCTCVQQQCSGAVSHLWRWKDCPCVWLQLNWFFKEEPPRYFEHKNLQNDVH